ncbi:hypothetical protein [Streptomyces subrutilus]|uniref:hypothetical protein n=1 Tax=Streptomyces subrutilus TaxID=36818 RepID=UPI0033EF9E2E
MMIMMRVAVAAAAALALSLPATTAAAGGQHAVPQALPMGVAVSALPPAVEDRTGYQRTKFRHWNAGEFPSDGCNTRQEVLLSEAVDYPAIGPGWALSGDMWVSYYDDVSVTDAARLDIDHMVPLAEAWASGGLYVLRQACGQLLPGVRSSLWGMRLSGGARDDEWVGGGFG